MGIFKSATPEQIQKQFATNVFGLMNVTKALLLLLRSHRKGAIGNVTSVGGRVAFPLYHVSVLSRKALDKLKAVLKDGALDPVFW